MHAQLLKILVCPVCKTSLIFEGEKSGDRLSNGVIQCSEGHLYQVKDEIPIIKDPKISQDEFTWKVKFPNLQQYDEIQQKYRSYISEEQNEADKSLIKELAGKVSNEELVVDIGSGMGNLLLGLADQSHKKARLMGTDVDETPLRGAKMKLEELKSYHSVSLCVMDGKHLAIKPQKLACITSFFGFDNIPDSAEAFREANRVLIQNGRLTFATMWLKEDSRSMSLAERLGYGAIGTEERLKETLEKTGFRSYSAETFYSGKWPHNPMDRIPVEGDWFAHVMILARRK